MKVPAILGTAILTLLAGCQHQDNVSTTFTALTGSLFQSQEEKQTNRVSSFIREGDIQRAEIEASQLAIPFLRAQSLFKIAHYQITEQNDLVGAKKLVEKSTKHYLRFSLRKINYSHRLSWPIYYILLTENNLKIC